MKKNGLTLTMVFLAESANYGEGVGNITALKKMTRGDFQQYSYISRQAIRYWLYVILLAVHRSYMKKYMIYTIQVWLKKQKYIFYIHIL